MPFKTKLLDRFRNKDALIFCGAGISRDYPAGLPDWHELRDNLIESVARLNPVSSPLSAILRDSAMLAEPGKRGMTPEVVASVIEETSTRLFNAMQVLEDGQPNSNHLLLANLAGSGYLPAIITTNWDRFLERAFESTGVAYTAYRTDDEFATFPDSVNDGTCRIVKLHGCISVPRTIIATVEQEGRGLSQERLRQCDSLLRRFFFVFWGYSGADLKIDLDYFGSLSAMDGSPGFLWNLHKTSTNQEAPNKYIMDLVQRYGDRANVTSGLLPDALYGLLNKPPPHLETPPDPTSWSHSRKERLRMALNTWAESNVDDIVACCIIGTLLEKNGNGEEAATCFREMERLGLKSGDRTAVGAALNNLGNIYKGAGNYEEAEPCYRKAITFHNDAREEGVALRNLGDVLGRLGRIDDAFKTYETASEKLRSVGDDRGVGIVDTSRAQILAQAGRRVDAISLYQRAEALFSSIGDKLMLAEALGNRAVVHRQLGELKDAEECLIRSIDIERILGNRVGLGYGLYRLGNIRLTAGETTGAEESFASAEQIALAFDDTRLLAQVIHSQASLALQERQFDRAVELLQRVLTLAESISEIQIIGGTHFGLLTANRALERYDDAVRHGATAAAIFEELRDWPTAAAAYRDTADTYLLYLNDMGKAAYGYRIALTFTRLGFQSGERDILDRLEQCKGGPRSLQIMLLEAAEQGSMVKALIEQNPHWLEFGSAIELRDELHRLARISKGEPMRALAYWLTLASLCSQIDDRKFLAGALNEAGMIWSKNAESLFGDSCIIAEGVRDWRTFAMSAFNLATLRERGGDLHGAEGWLAKASTAALQIGDNAVRDRIKAVQGRLTSKGS